MAVFQSTEISLYRLGGRFVVCPSGPRTPIGDENLERVDPNWVPNLPGFCPENSGPVCGSVHFGITAQIAPKPDRKLAARGPDVDGVILA